ncbi:MAG: hypothetical protein VW456_07865, partial [Alphaproteobacteria bacterium]
MRGAGLLAQYLGLPLSKFTYRFMPMGWYCSPVILYLRPSMPHASLPTSNSSLSSSSSVGVVMRDTPIIFACEILGDGAGREIFGDEVSHLLADARLAWAHLDANHADTATWLASQISDLDDIVIE